MHLLGGSMLTCDGVVHRAQQHVFPCLVGRATNHSWFVQCVWDARPILGSVRFLGLSNQETVRREAELQGTFFYTFDINAWLSQVRARRLALKMTNTLI